MQYCCVEGCELKQGRSLFHFLADHSNYELLESAVERYLEILMHLYFNHNENFKKFEAKTNLCSRFIFFGAKYNLIAEDFLEFSNSEMKNLKIEIPSSIYTKRETSFEADSISLEKSVNVIEDLGIVMNELNVTESVSATTSGFSEQSNFTVTDVGIDENNSGREQHGSSDEIISLNSLDEGILSSRSYTIDSEKGMKMSPKRVSKSGYLSKGKYLVDSFEHVNIQSI